MESRLKPLALRHSDQEPGVYVIFCKDGGLYRHDGTGGSCSRVASLPFIVDYEGPFRVDYHHPFVCVSQRFGLRCAVVDLRNGRVRECSREDYHADVSSYSVGFLQYGTRQWFVHQTEWNRLEITDLETGEHMNPQAVHDDTYGGMNESQVEECFDYFHSLLHVSPDGRMILSNGWIWHPVGIVRCYSIEQLLEGREHDCFALNCDSDYNWDRPCTFIDDDLFVVAVDDKPAFFVSDDDSSDDNVDDIAYHQLWFYRMSDHRPSDHQLRPCKKAICDVFSKNEEGEVHGELYYDSALKGLIAISGTGSWVLTVDGQVQSHLPEAVGLMYGGMYDYRRSSPEVIAWQYNTLDHCLYTWDAEVGRAVTISCT